MKWKKIPHAPLAQAIAVVLVAGAVGAVAPKIHAATAAGTQIRNLATVTYEDAVGNVYSAQSNEAIVTVAQVFSATLGVDVDVAAASGQTVYLPYVLTNTGNGDDTYNLTALDGITNGDDIDASDIRIFHDLNGSGEPDAGEPEISSLTLPANVNNFANLIVAVSVPSSATDGQELGITLTATPQSAAANPASVVTDLTAGGGRDTLDGTNESLITVTGDAVLVTTKSSVHNVAANEITYTVTVRNNGNVSASDVVIFDGLPANTTLVSSSVSGILASNGDTINTTSVLSESVLGLDINADGDTVDNNETTLGIDLNTDGDTADTGISGIYAIDSELPAQAAVSLTFTVSYDPAALGGGYVVMNQGFASGDTDEDGNPDSLVPSNVRQDVINPSFGVVISDTGAGASPVVNDGGDDDATLNDDQFVDQIAAGGIVEFTSIITNTGNADDIFELSVNTGNFPAGTVFTFFDANGVVLLSDTNGSGIDSGVIASGASKTIVVKATLPSNASGAAAAPASEYQATITATSANDTSSTPAADTTAVSLGIIVDAASDLHNAANGTLGNDEDPLGLAPFVAANTFTGTVGNTVTIPLYIDNESAGPDSFVLNVGSVWDGTTLGSLPSGWSVEFFLGNGSGAPTGAAITTTPVIPGSTVDFEIIAVVSIPNDGTLAEDDLVFDNDGDGVADTLDGNADGDGDYPLFFQIESQNTGSTDIVLDAIDVDATRQLSLVTPGSNQVDPGGSVVYGHTLSNTGNVTEVVELTSSHIQNGWTSTISIDTDGDGVVDTVLGNLTPGTITVQQANGVVVSVVVTDNDGDGNPELAVNSGVSLPISATVFAPANASPGETDVLTITATNVDPSVGAPSVSVDDLTTVINGQVRLTKTVAVDANCDGAPETGFAAVQSTGIAPGECAVWRVVAENQGTADASNVVITDSVPAFSSYEVNSLQYCLSNGCSPTPVTDNTTDDAGSESNGSIVFFVGNNANPSASEGGVLIAGEQATAQFSVRVQ